MKKEITIGEITLTIRRVKMRQIKPLLNDVADKAKAFFAIFDNPSDDTITPLIAFVSDNLDWLIDIIADQTDQTSESLEELDVLEFVELCSEIVRYNIPDIDLAKIKAFLEPPQPIDLVEEAEAALAEMTFGEELPTTAAPAPALALA